MNAPSTPLNALTTPFDALTPSQLKSRQTFDCGETSLNDYLAKTMRRHHEQQVARSFLIIKDDQIIGYYSLVGMTVKLPEELAKKLGLPFHKLPATLLARFAIDKRFQKQGYGELLLVDALDKARLAAKNVGSVCLFVEAIDQNSFAFYQSYGFVQLPNEPLSLFLPI